MALSLPSALTTSLSSGLVLNFILNTVEPNRTRRVSCSVRLKSCSPILILAAFQFPCNGFCNARMRKLNHISRQNLRGRNYDIFRIFGIIINEYLEHRHSNAKQKSRALCACVWWKIDRKRREENSTTSQQIISQNTSEEESVWKYW